MVLLVELTFPVRVRIAPPRLMVGLPAWLATTFSALMDCALPFKFTTGVPEPAALPRLSTLPSGSAFATVSESVPSFTVVAPV